MKLRLRENSVRLRLLQSEVKHLKEGREVSEKITFSASQNLVYTLKVCQSSKEISAELSGGEILVKIPSQTAINWIESDLVGLENEQNIEDGTSLKILIEKDFVCLDRPFDTDNTDAFPHPKSVC